MIKTEQLKYHMYRMDESTLQELLDMIVNEIGCDLSEVVLVPKSELKNIIKELIEYREKENK